MLKLAIAITIGYFAVTFALRSCGGYDDGYNWSDIPAVELPEELQRFEHPSTDVPRMIAAHEKIEASLAGTPAVCPICGTEYNRYDTGPYLVCCSRRCEREYRAIVDAWEDYQEVLNEL